MPRNDEPRGAVGWLRRWWRALLAELVATCTLLWLGIVALAPVAGPQPLSHCAMAFGFAVLANAMAFGPVSGAHMNPAVTLAALIYGQLPPLAALAYALAQLAGATLGIGLMMATNPEGVVTSALVCTTPRVSPAGAVALEAAITGTLVLAVCSVWSDKGPDPAAPIKLGLVVAGLVYVAGPSTGASLNPARSFGPALLFAHWDYQWVYWVGPLLGAALAAALHRWVLAPRPAAPAPADPAALPLSDKP